MQLPSPYSTVTSQQQLDRIKVTVQMMLEVEPEEADMWLALCKLDIEYYVSCCSYNPRYIAKAPKARASRRIDLARVWITLPFWGYGNYSHRNVP